MGTIWQADFHSTGVRKHGSHNGQEGMLEPLHDVLSLISRKLEGVKNGEWSKSGGGRHLEREMTRLGLFLMHDVAVIAD